MVRNSHRSASIDEGRLLLSRFLARGSPPPFIGETRVHVPMVAERRPLA